jgi:hypothetical protein
VVGRRITTALPIRRCGSFFDCPPACVSDAVALDPNLSAAHPHGPALRRGEPLADQVGQHIDGETIGEQSPFGVAAWTAGEEFQRLALFPAKVWFLRGWHELNVGPGMPVREASSCPRVGWAFIPRSRPA